MRTDSELLRRYGSHQDGDAFAELVKRHLGLVYAAALRRTGGRHALAEDIAQKVFVRLVRQAGRLTNHPTLVGWLYRTTRHVAIDVMRSEHSREKLVQTLTSMPDVSSSDEPVADWEQLRPVIDDAMDQLKDRDREIMLLRFFQGMTFREIGATLRVSENNARMRTTRALEKLRHHLARRGIQSTAGLAALLETASATGAPPTLAATVTQAALAAAPASTAAALFSGLLAGKVAACLLGATVGVAVTAGAWTTLARDVDDAELRALRSENERLRQASLAGNLAAVAQEIAGEYVARATTILHTKAANVAQRRSEGSARHRDRGQATPRDAFLSLFWAIDAGDPDALARILTFDPKSRDAIRSLHERMPPEIRVEYPSPEEFVAFLYAADAILNPVPGPDVLEKFVITETGPGQAGVRAPSASRDGMQVIQTDEGWKCVVPPGYPEHMARRILGSDLLARLGAN